MSTLLLPINFAPFEVMVTGEKQYEYRLPGKWIESRLFDKQGKPRHYDFVEFINGYGATRPRFRAKFLFFQKMRFVKQQYSNGLVVNCGPCWMIAIGEIVSIENYVIPEKS